MRRITNWVIGNWYVVVVGCILQRFAISYAIQERGYLAFGGEFLVLPFVVMFYGFINCMYWEIHDFLTEEGTYAESDRRDCE